MLPEAFDCSCRILGLLVILLYFYSRIMNLGHGPFSHLFDGVKKKVLKDSKVKSQKAKGCQKERESHFGVGNSSYHM